MNMKLLLGIVMAVAMLSFSVAATNEFGEIISGGKLLVTDIDVKVDGSTDKNLKFGDKVDEELKPGSSVEFVIEFSNNFTNTQDLQIEDIEVDVTIEGIDDDDDLDEDAKEFDLDADDNDDVRVSFDIPMEVDDGNYDVLIEANGDDENGTSHSVRFRLELEVQKEDDEVRISNFAVSPSELKCSRSAQISISIVNTGADEQDDTVLEITNGDLNINVRETFDLTDDPFDDDSKFKKSFTVNVPVNQASGIYPIQAVVSYGSSDEESANADLVIAACESAQAPATKPTTPKSSDSQKEEDKKDETVVVNKPSQPVVISPPVTSPQLPSGSASKEQPLLKSQTLLTALIVGEVLLVIIAIVIIVAVMRRKD